MKAFDQAFQERTNEHLSMFQVMKEDAGFRRCVETAATIVLETVRGGGAVYLCGNGGSAADAQHIATEFVSRFYLERRAINAEALTVNTSSLTAIGNDHHFDRIFERQLEAKGRPGDVLIGISTSGMSDNVVRALEYALQHGIRTILLTGDRQEISDQGLYECVIKIPSKDTPRIQEGHIFVGHMIAEYVEAAIATER